ncbi:hypothetical protein BJV78DRAFT_1359515 [Lactifluus subvellereus]|nr:hypothetical protein BJV78DRAFT_1359515 [Lactifluus subvellereus]
MPSSAPERPTLPPLRSLALPMHGVPSNMTLPGINELYNDQLDPSHVAALHAWQRRRRETVSSPTSPHAPSPPPPPSIAGPLTSTLYYGSATPNRLPTQHTNHAEPHVRLVLTDSFENADAALVLCSAGAPSTSGAPRMISSPDALGGIKPGAPLLVVGPALERIRRPGTVLGKGVKMHPYRIVHPTSTTPNSSIATGTYYAPRK